ncbi:hypothetical protein [Xinfangfangia pollutisoli]|uniref:hypothetical protein n=1 Tax=Xinfangfangia pollutisoli TaxID=2865960 RepID=UPI001CD20637|nr:hypothetical protein [Xinfangfangia pollutisoli]
MALELVGALIAAAALGLFAWALRRWFPGLPKWLVPVAAGLGLIGTTVVLEYGWYARVSAQLPPGYQVVHVENQSMPLRPWTYLWPIHMGFVALDASKTMTHPQVPTLRMVTLYSFARWKPVEQALMAVDCAASRRVLVTAGVEITAEGQLRGGEWQVVEPDDTLQEAACREG